MPSLPDDLAAACARARADGLLHGAILAVGRSSGAGARWAWGDASVVPERRPMRTDGIIDVASLTKVVATATACGVAIDLGLLDPEAPAGDYLPELAQLPGAPIRVRDLATHTSGHDGAKVPHGVAGEALIEAVVRMPPRWAPRTTCVYSCRNLILLGLIVERVTGEPLAAFCRRRIFAPLGMSDTSFGPLGAEGGRVVPTEQAAGTISDFQARDAGRAVGHAGLFSTAADLAAFSRMLLAGGRSADGRILGDAALRWLLAPCSPPGLPLRAFGWDMRPPEPWKRPAMSDAAIGHAGWTGQSLWIDPRQDVYAIVLTNRTHAPTVADNYEANYRFRTAMLDQLVARMHAER